MAIRNTPSITPLRRPKPPPPPPSVDGSDRAKLRQAQEAQKRAQTPSYTPWTGGGNASFVAPPGAAPFVEYGVDRSGDRMGGNLSFGGGGGRQEEAPTRTPQYGDFAQNWRDPEYNSQIASLNRALQDFETGAQQRGERYGIDYLQGVRNIGYRPAPGFVAMPNILEAAEEQASPTAARAIMGSEQPDPTANLQGQWDLEGQFNPYSAAARGTRGTRDEFAGRGTLRSSDFAKTFGDFQNRLNEQLGAMETGRTRFAEDLSGDVARQRTETEERRQAAERAAINRAATAQMNAYLRSLAGG